MDSEVHVQLVLPGGRAERQAHDTTNPLADPLRLSHPRDTHTQPARTHLQRLASALEQESGGRELEQQGVEGGGAILIGFSRDNDDDGA